MAQKYLEVYQNGKVTNSFATTSIDSVGLTGNTPQDRKVNFYRDGKVVSNYLVSGVDSIKVFRSNEEPLVYLGIIGFNQQLYEKPFDVLATSTSNLYQSFVNNLPRKDGTILYYAVDHALDALENYDFKTPIKNVTLITFTDGLDQGSLMMNNHFTTDEQYLNAVSQRISNTKIKGLPLTAYSLGLVGNDVSNYSLFRNNLNKLASSFEKAFEVSNMNDVQTRLKEISDQIISINTKQTFSMKIPGHSDGTLIRFTLDGSSTDNSSMYIEGTFNLANRSLTNVTYHGIKATTGSFVQGTQDGIFVNFTFTGLQREDGVGLIPTYQTREYYKNVGSNTWQRNSEFSPNNNTQTTVTHSGAVIVLVLDCSNSLGSQFSNMRSYANDFINRVATNTSKFEVLAPTNVKAFIPDDNFEIKVTWDAVKHAESYDVYRSSNSSNGFTKVAGEVISTSWVDEKPLNGNNYYRVYAVGHGLTSPSSKTSSVNYALDAPTNVNAEIQDDDFTIRLSWDAVKHAESYDVYRSSNSSSGYTKVADGVTSTSWVDEKPLNGNNYYRVYAVGHGLTSSAGSTSVYIIKPTCPDTHHAHEIDLGLPSGTKWACSNVGATKPEEYGGYYAWGETEEKSYYDWSTYKYYKNGEYLNIGTDISGTEYDVAHVKWGGNWCMPTYDDIQELLDNCTYEWTTLNGVKGTKFTSKINGNSIFLPAAGCRCYGHLDGAGEYGGFWSSTQDPDYSGYACSLYFSSGDAYWGYDVRYYGRSVRPVVRN